MNKIFQTAISTFIFFVSCSSINSNMKNNLDSGKNIPVSKDRLYTDIKEITSILPSRNSNNIQSLDQTAEYIYSQFAGLTDNIEIQSYRTGEKEYKNIICSFGPLNAERIVVGAHYDVCGDQPGADDNASGVAGLLEIARLIKELKPKLEKRIDLVAYSLEEPPYFRTEFMGSFVHAKKMAESDVKIKAMISLEMIGYFSNEPKSQYYPVSFLKWFYPEKGDFIAVVGKIGQGGIIRKIKKHMSQVSKINIESLSAPSFVQGIDFSDHMNYWKYKYNAVMITDTSFYRNRNYHKTSDKIETLDFDKMSEVVKGVYWAVVNL